jgi:transitional endoplasmic reticulum ATPase
MIYNYLNHVFTTGDIITLGTHGGKIQFVVTSTKQTKPVIAIENTIFKLGPMTKAIDVTIPRITYDELGGLKNEVQKIRKMIELPMKHPELFKKIGVEAPKGVLLYGPPETGKTMIAKALAIITDSNFISIKGLELLSKWVVAVTNRAAILALKRHVNTKSNDIKDIKITQQDLIHKIV